MAVKNPDFDFVPLLFTLLKTTSHKFPKKSLLSHAKLFFKKKFAPYFGWGRRQDALPPNVYAVSKSSIPNFLQYRLCPFKQNYGNTVLFFNSYIWL